MKIQKPDKRTVATIKNKRPPYQVKSLLVDNAYTKRDSVIPAVKSQANSTILGSVAPHNMLIKYA